MSATLPPRPSLEWLKKTAKDRLELLHRSEPLAKLAEAQLAVARDYGFPSWRALKRHVEELPASQQVPSAEQIVAAFLLRVGQGRLADVRALLTAVPRLVNAVGPHPFWGGRPQALHVAIEGKRRDMFDLLLEHSADVNGSNSKYDHWSPLMLAINRDVPEMRDELIARGARIGLLEALMLADDARVDALLASEGLRAIAPNAGSIVAFARTPFAIDRLIDLGAPTDTRDRWGSTPIDAMSRLGRRGDALVRHMVARGITANAKDYARLGDLSTLARLVEADPSVAKLDAVMMGAVDFGHRAIVEWLLAHGANVNARSDAESRHTALHSAAWNGDLEMVKLLVAAGADRTARDAQYDAPPQGWAETSIQVSNNPKCADVVSYFDALT
jgi:ankyrin repeat protein